jgi:hypothetical protein
MSSVKYFLIIVFLSSTTAWSYQETLTKEQAHQRFIEILKTEGSNAALEFIDGFLNVSQDYKTVYLIGWAEFRRRNFGDAEMIARFLEEHAYQEDMLAATQHLLGNIFTYDEDPATDPTEYFLMSSKLYAGIDHFRGVYRSYLGLSMAALARGDLKMAGRHQVLAYRLAVKHDLDLALYHSLAHQINLGLGNYEKARDHLLKELELQEARGNLVRQHEIGLHLAFVYLLMDDVEKASVFNQHSLGFFIEREDEIFIFHGELNHYFIGGCKEGSSEEELLERQLQERKLPGFLQESYRILKQRLCFKE